MRHFFIYVVFGIIVILAVAFLFQWYNTTGGRVEERLAWPSSSIKDIAPTNPIVSTKSEKSILSTPLSSAKPEKSSVSIKSEKSSVLTKPKKPNVSTKVEKSNVSIKSKESNVSTKTEKSNVSTKSKKSKVSNTLEKTFSSSKPKQPMAPNTLEKSQPSAKSEQPTPNRLGRSLVSVKPEQTTTNTLEKSVVSAKPEQTTTNTQEKSVVSAKPKQTTTNTLEKSVVSVKPEQPTSNTLVSAKPKQPTTPNSLGRSLTSAKPEQSMMPNASENPTKPIPTHVASALRDGMVETSKTTNKPVPVFTTPSASKHTTSSVSKYSASKYSASKYNMPLVSKYKSAKNHTTTIHSETSVAAVSDTVKEKDTSPAPEAILKYVLFSVSYDSNINAGETESLQLTMSAKSARNELEKVLKDKKLQKNQINAMEKIQDQYKYVSATLLAKDNCLQIQKKMPEEDKVYLHSMNESAADEVWQWDITAPDTPTTSVCNLSLFIRFCLNQNDCIPSTDPDKKFAIFIHITLSNKVYLWFTGLGNIAQYATAITGLIGVLIGVFIWIKKRASRKMNGRR